mgnify:CR=1 FL=1
MADVTLSDGREIVFDLYQITVLEWDQIRDPAQPRQDEFRLLGKTCGMTAAEVGALPFPDYTKLTRAFVERCRDPLGDAPST